MACACDSLSPLTVEEKAVSWTWCALAMAFYPLYVEEKSVSGLPGVPPERPQKDPKSGQGAPEPKTSQFCAKFVTQIVTFGRGDFHSFRAVTGHTDHGNIACACDSLFPLPVEGKAIMGT